MVYFLYAHLSLLALIMNAYVVVNEDVGGFYTVCTCILIPVQYCICYHMLFYVEKAQVYVILM